MRTENQPEGLCQCGCGQGTTRVSLGRQKAHYFRRYVHGHQARSRYSVTFSSDKDRFQDYIYADPNSGCHIFCGSETKKGYGLFKFTGSKTAMLAHRAAFVLLADRKLSPQEQVLHRCDVPSCVNLDHLYLGSNNDNRRDMVVRNRGHKGKYPYGVQVAKSGLWNARFALPNRGGSRSLGNYGSLEQAAAVAAFVRAVAYGLRGMM